MFGEESLTVGKGDGFVGRAVNDNERLLDLPDLIGNATGGHVDRYVEKGQKLEWSYPALLSKEPGSILHLTQ